MKPNPIFPGIVVVANLRMITGNTAYVCEMTSSVDNDIFERILRRCDYHFSTYISNKNLIVLSAFCLLGSQVLVSTVNSAILA